jgi:hypothetical protein
MRRSASQRHCGVCRPRGSTSNVLGGPFYYDEVTVVTAIIVVVVVLVVVVEKTAPRPWPNASFNGESAGPAILPPLPDKTVKVPGTIGQHFMLILIRDSCSY